MLKNKAPRQYPHIAISSWKSIFNVKLMACLLCIVTASAYLKSVEAEQLSYTDAHIKAAYILKLKEFVFWPHDFDVTEICVVGSDFIGSSLAQLQASIGNGQKVRVEKKTGSAVFSSCHIVYVSKNEPEQLKQVLFSIGAMPILTVSDVDGFAEQGGIIEFVEVNKKIKMNVNLINAQKQRISISSKLLQVANQVLKK